MNAFRFHLLVPLLVLAVAPAMAAEDAPLLENADQPSTEDGFYYRWIDAQGHVQFTDFEPIGIPAQRVPLTPPEDENAPALSEADGVRESDPFYDQDQQILPIAHAGPCADARQQLAVLHAGLPVYRDGKGQYRAAWRGDTYRGTRTYLEADERTDAIRTAQAAVRKHCSDPAAFEREVEAFQDGIRDN
ncbi:MAG: DUF4124 domain-containing protein [Pseudomonadales bacterium]